MTPKVGQAVAFYPSADDPGYLVATAVVATVMKVYEDDSCDLDVEGVLLEHVEPLAAGEHGTPHTWSP